MLPQETGQWLHIAELPFAGVINRAERALEKAVAEGSGKAVVVQSTLSAAAVA